ncbi:MAG: exodeoxyribonuclease VII large subunit [Puniceicoccales bacterium]|nr:exodeoxyribonuclease VII large subunit [Puniceicoccales bacterium]
MDLFAMQPGPAAPDVLSVSEFSRRLRGILEGTFPLVSVRGEISNLRSQASGHLYFTLKDPGSQLSAVLFRGDAQHIRCVPRDGMQVVATGAIGAYEPRGTYQLIVRQMEDHGLGRLQKAFEHLRQKLAAEGLFARARKRALPLVPLHIAIISSPSGAALQDFLRILHRRDWRGHVLLIPVRVQGETAASEITTALTLAQTLTPCPDVLVLARGGGSLEDLWPFNEEKIVRAICASPIPIISAVGHEIDFTLADFAADVRAETPSAAAELISSSRLACTERLARVAATFTREIHHRAEILSHRLGLLQAELARHEPRRRLESLWLRLDDLRSRLDMHAPRERLRLMHQQIEHLRNRLGKNITHWNQRATDRLASLHSRLFALGTEPTLRRGFAIVRDDAKKLVASANAIVPQKSFSIQFADGSAQVTSYTTQTVPQNK